MTPTARSDDVTDREVAEMLRAGARASTDPDVIAAADVVVVCVPTPLRPDHTRDLGHVTSAVETITDRVVPACSSCSSRRRTPARRTASSAASRNARD